MSAHKNPPTKAEREARKHRTTHEFILGQGERKNDTRFIKSSPYPRKSTPTQHGAHLMRSYHEAAWAAHFESKGFSQAPILSPIAFPTPCYFFEPYGMRRWPSYKAAKCYRIDFVLVYEIKRDPYRPPLFCAKRWEWVSIKPIETPTTNLEIEQDRQWLVELVQFDSLHQRAMQLCGLPDQQHHIYSMPNESGKISYIDRDGQR